MKLKKKTEIKLINLSSKIALTKDVEKLHKHWNNFFNISMHLLGYSSETRRKMFKTFRKDWVNSKHLEELNVGDLRKTFYDNITNAVMEKNINESIIFESHWLFMYIIKRMKREEKETSIWDIV